MSTDNQTDHEIRFSREWHAWLDRPVAQSPEAAAARISGILRDSRGRRHRVWPLATAAASVSLLIMICLFPRRISTELPVTTAPVPVQSEPAQPGEVLMWLDEDTPLYMHFQPPTSQGGNKS